MYDINTEVISGRANFGNEYILQKVPKKYKERTLKWEVKELDELHRRTWISPL